MLSQLFAGIDKPEVLSTADVALLPAINKNF